MNEGEPTGASVPTWQQVAEVLAERLNHAECDSHPSDRPGPECPFCHDRAAYALYLNKAGLCRPRLPGTPVALHDLPPNPSATYGGRQSASAERVQP